MPARGAASPRCQYGHLSPLSGLPDKPESYHTVTIELSEEGAQTRVSLSQGDSTTAEARDHSAENWAMMVTALNEFLEK